MSSGSQRQSVCCGVVRLSAYSARRAAGHETTAACPSYVSRSRPVLFCDTPGEPAAAADSQPRPVGDVLSPRSSPYVGPRRSGRQLESDVFETGIDLRTI